MKLIANKRRLALYSLSLWANRLGILVLVLPELWYLAAGFDVIGPAARFVIGVALMILAEVLRYVDQGGLDR